MRAPLLSVSRARPSRRQASGAQPQVLAEVLQDGVNLAVWQRAVPAPVATLVEHLLARGEPLNLAFSLELATPEAEPGLQGLLGACDGLVGAETLVADVAWLVRAYACLLDARRIGLRLRALDRAMCPRFHVDHVPLRLITTYAGVGSQWLGEGVMDRRGLGQPEAEPTDEGLIERAAAGHVLLAKGENWLGNEGGGLIHRSPQPLAGERRLLLTLDWLA